MIHGRYKVTGKREYRGHRHGTIFEALLDPLAEQRAIDRGDIVLLERMEPSVRNRPHTFPRGWLPTQPHPQSEAPSGASVIEGG